MAIPLPPSLPPCPSGLSPGARRRYTESAVGKGAWRISGGGRSAYHHGRSIVIGGIEMLRLALPGSVLLAGLIALGACAPEPAESREAPVAATAKPRHGAHAGAPPGFLDVRD